MSFFMIIYFLEFQAAKIRLIIIIQNNFWNNVKNIPLFFQHVFVRVNKSTYLCATF